MQWLLLKTRVLQKEFVIHCESHFYKMEFFNSSLKAKYLFGREKFF